MRGQPVEGGGEEFAERVAGGVGKIGHDEIVAIGIGVEPAKGVGVDDVDTWGGERMLVQCREHRVRGEKLRHLRIEIHERHAFDRWILQDFAHRQAVAAAQHQHAAGAGKRGQARMH